MGNHPGSTDPPFQGAPSPAGPENGGIDRPVDLDDKTYALVITGPNTGGKTVTLKTIGLLVLMAQSGLQIPVGVRFRALTVFDRCVSPISATSNLSSNRSRPSPGM